MKGSTFRKFWNRTHSAALARARKAGHPDPSQFAAMAGRQAGVCATFLYVICACFQLGAKDAIGHLGNALGQQLATATHVYCINNGQARALCTAMLWH
eukprot:8860812-Pyramimonas_sp.AAC.1